MPVLAAAVVLALLAGGCGADDGAERQGGGATAAGDDTVAIHCSAFYRRSVRSAELAEASFAFGAGSARERAPFAELVLSANHFDDPHEGRGLVLYVTEPGSEERLAQQTYAFQHGGAPENVFGDLPDGHGFTGMHYHYSEGGAELQYYCGRG